MKHTCKLCCEPICHKSEGFKCSGACKCWYHLKCLKLTPEDLCKIKCDGKLAKGCRCPPCKTRSAEKTTNYDYCKEKPQKSTSIPNIPCRDPCEKVRKSPAVSFPDDCATVKKKECPKPPACKRKCEKSSKKSCENQSSFQKLCELKSACEKSLSSVLCKKTSSKSCCKPPKKPACPPKVKCKNCPANVTLKHPDCNCPPKKPKPKKKKQCTPSKAICCCKAPPGVIDAACQCNSCPAKCKSILGTICDAFRTDDQCSPRPSFPEKPLSETKLDTTEECPKPCVPGSPPKSCEEIVKQKSEPNVSCNKFYDTEKIRCNLKKAISSVCALKKQLSQNECNANNRPKKKKKKKNKKEKCSTIEDLCKTLRLLSCQITALIKRALTELCSQIQERCDPASR